MLRTAAIALIVIQGWMNPLAIVNAAMPLPDNALLEELKASKTYMLDIRYGMTEQPFTTSTNGAFTGLSPTQGFLDNAQSIHIGVDLDESGTFSQGNVNVGYALIPDKDAPPILRFAFMYTDPDYYTSVQTRITIVPDKWTTISVTESTAENGPTVYDYIVVKLVEQ